jgi:hypothetical protein
MAIITIECRLTAPEATRRHLWDLMAHRNTPLVGALIQIIQTHENFSAWQRQGEIPLQAARELCKPLREEEPFSGQPGRFYSSASMMVTYTYKAWFALQASRQRRLEGIQRWLAILKSDAEMLEICNVSLETLQSRAQTVLQEANLAILTNPETQPRPKRGRKTQQAKTATTVSRRQLLRHLFQQHDDSDQLTRCAIIHLLKNGCVVPKKLESPKKYQQMLLSKQKAVQRLETQLASSLPKGRDMSGEGFLAALELITNQIPRDAEELSQWTAKLLREPSSIPYPILFGSNLDLVWSAEEVARGKTKTPKQQICVTFSGLAQHRFKVQCDRRHHHYFQRFVEDWRIYDRGKGPIGTVCEEGDECSDPWRDKDFH